MTPYWSVTTVIGKFHVGCGMSEERGITKDLMDRLRFVRYESETARMIRAAKRLRDSANAESLGEWGAWLALDEVLQWVFDYVAQHPRAPYLRNARGQYEGPGVVAEPMQDLVNVLVTVYAPVPYIIPAFDADDLLPSANKLDGLTRSWGEGQAVDVVMEITFILRSVAAAYHQERLFSGERRLCLACHQAAEDGMYYCRDHSPGTDPGGHMEAKRRGLGQHPTFGFGELRSGGAAYRISEYGLPTDKGRDGYNALFDALCRDVWDAEMIPEALCFKGNGAEQVTQVARAAADWPDFVSRAKTQLNIAADSDASADVISLLDLYCLQAGDDLRGALLREPVYPIKKPSKRGRKRGPELRQRVLEGLKAGKRQAEIARELDKKRQHVNQIAAELRSEGRI